MDDLNDATLPQNGRAAKRILDAEGLRRALTRIAHEILERHGGTDDLVLVGMRRRGVPIARRLADLPLPDRREENWMRTDLRAFRAEHWAGVLARPAAADGVLPHALLEEAVRVAAENVPRMKPMEVAGSPMPEP